MKIIKGVFLVIFIIISHQSFSVVAYPHPIDYIQPDGTTITVRQKGDEFYSWIETVDGYTILKNNEGVFEYATQDNKNNLICSGIKAYNEAERSLSENNFLDNQSKGLVISAEQVSVINQLRSIQQNELQNDFPTSGDRKLLCILMGFSDLAFTKTKTDFENLFNQVGYNTDGAQGSVNDYYAENSYNQLNLTITVAGPYTASENMAYYGASGTGYNDVNPRALIEEAVEYADADVNYADFDNDNDGYVDGIYVIYAGYGQEYYGVSTDAIWAHAWGIWVQKDGKWISDYSCSSELRTNSGTGITRIGVICHEFGHVLGAPDFYDTNYATGGEYTGTGQWDLMAGGTWNNNGISPAHHNGVTKYYIYNWISPIELSSAQYIELDNIEDNPELYYYSTPSLNEFWFLENRQQTGFDSYIPGHGMLIYHVDLDGVSSNIATNTINATHPQYFYPVCASATTNPSSSPSDYGVINSGGTPFPGTSSKTTFTDVTMPNSNDWADNPTEKPLTNITETSGVIEFSFMGGTEEITPAKLSITDITYSSGTDECFGATDTITVAGDGNAANINSGATITFIAGESVSFLPGFHAQSGCTMNAYITTTASFCDAPPSPIVSNDLNYKSINIEDVRKNKDSFSEKTVKVYPNPNNGKFNVELNNFNESAKIQIINSIGAIVYRNSIRNGISEIEFRKQQAGLYFINIISGKTVKTSKIIIQ